MATEMIWVAPVPNTKAAEGQVLLWDRDPEQKDGEVLIANRPEPVEVVETAGVALAIGDGRLKRVSKPATAAVIAPAAAPPGDEVPSSTAKVGTAKRKTGGKASTSANSNPATGDVGSGGGNLPPADATVGSGTEGDGSDDDDDSDTVEGA